MLAALVLTSKAHDLLTLLGEGTLVFLALLLSAGMASRGSWDSGRVSTKRYIAFCGLCTGIVVLLVAAIVIIKN